jgi:hypothetical protein
VTAEATTQNCESANVLNSALVTSQNVVVCAVALPAAAGAVAAFAEFQATVTVDFAGKGSVVGNASAFYNGTVYVPGQVNPWTGEVMTTEPAKPTLTVPPASFVLPTTIYEQYAIPQDASAAGLVQGVVEFSDASQPRNGLNISDVPAYLKLVNSTASATDLFVIGVDSIVSQFETTLDIELIMSVAPGAITYVYCISYGSGGTYAGYSDALMGFAATGATVTAGGHAPSAVWSISYGGPEWTSDPATYEHANTLLGHLSDAGVAVMSSSGDTGTYFYEVEQFFGEIVEQFVQFGPSWPAVSPHVVAVGASALRARQPADGAWCGCGAVRGARVQRGAGQHHHVGRRHLDVLGDAGVPGAVQPQRQGGHARRGGAGRVDRGGGERAGAAAVRHVGVEPHLRRHGDAAERVPRAREHERDAAGAAAAGAGPAVHGDARGADDACALHGRGGGRQLRGRAGAAGVVEQLPRVQPQPVLRGGGGVGRGERAGHAALHGPADRGADVGPGRAAQRQRHDHHACPARGGHGSPCLRTSCSSSSS